MLFYIEQEEEEEEEEGEYGPAKPAETVCRSIERHAFSAGFACRSIERHATPAEIACRFLSGFLYRFLFRQLKMHSQPAPAGPARRPNNIYFQPKMHGVRAACRTDWSQLKMHVVL